MRISYKWFLPVLILVFCCDNTKQQSNITNDFKASTQLITIEDINALGVVEQPLDLIVKDSIFSSWKAYHQILTQTDFIKKADLAFFESDLKSISKLMKPFNDSIPECFKTNGIVSRTKVVTSFIYKMHSTLKLKSVSKKERLDVVKSYMESVTHLNYQLNKKFEYDSYNVDFNE